MYSFQLEEQHNNFHKRLSAEYNNHERLALDGVINFDLFQASNPKILWILKEAYGEGVGILDKSYCHYINSFQFGKSFPSSARMWQKIIYTNYGILNDLNWNNIGELYNDKKIFNALKSCAIINLKKILGESVSNNRQIKSHYEDFKQIINEQILLIDPDIIICGNTFQLLTLNFQKK